MVDYRQDFEIRFAEWKDATTADLVREVTPLETDEEVAAFVERLRFAMLEVTSGPFGIDDQRPALRRLRDAAVEIAPAVLCDIFSALPDETVVTIKDEMLAGIDALLEPRRTGRPEKSHERATVLASAFQQGSGYREGDDADVYLNDLLLLIRVICHKNAVDIPTSIDRLRTWIPPSLRTPFRG